MSQINMVSWNVMIAGCIENGSFGKALETLNEMQLAGVETNSTTFAIILNASAKIGALEHGIDIHKSIEDKGLLSNVVVSTALVDMHAKWIL